MILSCQGISKSFGEKVILEDASFHIEEREKAALIGNNGAGKTTLLRIIMEEIPCRCRTGSSCQGQTHRLPRPVSGCTGTPFCI